MSFNVFKPVRSQQNEQWIWTSSLTELRIVGCLWVITGPYLQCVTYSPSYNSFAATTPLILTIFVLGSTQAQPEAKSEITALEVYVLIIRVITPFSLVSVSPTVRINIVLLFPSSLLPPRMWSDLHSGDVRLESSPGYQVSWLRNFFYLVFPYKFLLTYGAEPFSRSYRLCSHSRTSQHFMEPEGSLPCSHESSTGLSPAPVRSSPYHFVLSF
jgi:hypothetical protein